MTNMQLISFLKYILNKCTFTLAVDTGEIENEDQEKNVETHESESKEHKTDSEPVESIQRDSIHQNKEKVSSVHGCTFV